jgi:hypothetical protein
MGWFDRSVDHAQGKGQYAYQLSASSQYRLFEPGKAFSVGTVPAPRKGFIMTLYQPEPVEISTRMRPGEWTESSLEELVTTYRAKILGMGAAASEVATEVLRNDDGSVAVTVSWNKGDYADEPEGGRFTGEASGERLAGKQAGEQGERLAGDPRAGG